jgi:hypothetical protein
MIIKLTKEEVNKICIDYLFDKFNKVMEFDSIDYDHYNELVFKEKEI